MIEVQSSCERKICNEIAGVGNIKECFRQQSFWGQEFNLDVTLKPYTFHLIDISLCFCSMNVS